MNVININSLIFIITLRGRYYYHPNFRNEETEAKTGQVTFPRDLQIIKP
jgi:hypothetical protein